MKTYLKNDRNQKIVKELEELLPSTGSVPSRSPALERYRKASQAYEDAFKTGGQNRGASFRRLFGFGISRFRYSRFTNDGQKIHEIEKNLLHKEVEPIMDAIIDEAAQEQGLKKVA